MDILNWVNIMQYKIKKRDCRNCPMLRKYYKIINNISFLSSKTYTISTLENQIKWQLYITDTLLTKRMYLTMVQGSKIIRDIKLKYYLFEKVIYTNKRCTGQHDRIVRMI